LTKRCVYCGRYFIVDRRLGGRQKACGRDSCKKKRKQSSQRAWSAKNPDYYKGRYWYVKEWRQKRRRLKTDTAHLSQSMIQDTIPLSKPYRRLVLIIPETKAGVIQDEIRLRRVDNITFAAYGP
jgi:hypothetical protein